MLEVKSLDSIKQYISNDNETTRLIARVFFVRNIHTYYALIDYLSSKADLVLRLSDPQFCKGSDTVPDLKTVIEVLDDNTDKNILIPHLGEYLRIGELVERSSNCVHSILNRHVHSSKRVWLPLFLAEDPFNSIVGSLDEERFEDYLLSVDEPPSSFSVTVYSSLFDNQKCGIDSNGIRSWLSRWDNQEIASGMSFSTRHIKQMEESEGDYTITIVEEPFAYILQKTQCATLTKSMGTREQWLSLIPFVEDGVSLDLTINRAFNQVSFDPLTCLSKWDALSNNEKWLLQLRNAVYPERDTYYTYALSKCADISEFPESLQNSILECTNSVLFDKWLDERKALLRRLPQMKYGSSFWKRMEALSDDTQLQILSNETHEERVKIIEIVSKKLNNGTSLDSILFDVQTKYPDLALYLSEPKHIDDSRMRDYISKYKINKVKNEYSKEFSKYAESLDIYEYDTRNTILNGIKHSVDAYYLWMDGMGLEWIDLLLEKIESKTVALGKPIIKIGTAAIPTVTSVNMEKMDPATLSGKKFDKLDYVSHIKDKSDINYYSLIAKQFDIIEEIADIVIAAASNNSTKDIVITADHGMSRMAALGFHYGQKISAPDNADVYNHGRYCYLNDSKAKVPNTIRSGDYLAFSNHDHFSVSGFAPGEIHGGASPEEVLVPIIHFSKKRNNLKSSVSYSLLNTNYYRNNNGMVDLKFKTKGLVNSAFVMVNGKKYKAIKTDENDWTAEIDGLETDRIYSLKIMLNNLNSNKTEHITIKRKGLEVDDFDFI